MIGKEGGKTVPLGGLSAEPTEVRWGRHDPTGLLPGSDTVQNSLRAPALAL